MWVLRSALREHCRSTERIKQELHTGIVSPIVPHRQEPGRGTWSEYITVLGAETPVKKMKKKKKTVLFKFN